MASIKGITIDIGGNTSKLESALQNVNKTVYTTNSNLRELNKALKLDPTNTEALATKQKVLQDNIRATTERLNTLKEAQKQMGDYNSLTEEQKEQYKNLSIEIAKSEANLKKMNGELEATKSGNLSSVNNEMEKVGNTAIKVGDLIKANLASEAIIRAFDSIVGKVRDVASGIGKMVVQGGMDRALNLENAKAKMSTFTKDSKQLDEIMNNVSDSVDGTAFSMDSAATVASGLFAAGIKEGPQMTNSLKLVGDAAQVSGRSMEEIGAIFNKVAANGKLSGQELNQLSDSGIPILQMLSKTTGKSAEEVRKLVSDGKIGFAEFSKAMEEGLGGAAQKSGETFTSSLANLKSAVSRIGATIMTPLLEGVTPVMNTFKDMLKLMAKGTTDGLDKLAGQLETQINDLAGNILNNIGPFLEKMIPVLGNVLSKLLDTLPDALSDVMAMITYSIGDLVSVLLSNIPNILHVVLYTIEGILFSIADQLPVLIPQIVQAILGLVDVLIGHIDTFIDVGIKIILGLMEGIIRSLPIIISKIPEVIQKLVSALISAIPLLIQGAIQLVMMVVQNLPTIINSLISALPLVIESIVSGLLEALPLLIQGAIELVVQLVAHLPEIIITLVKATPQVIKALASGLLGASGQLVNAGVKLIKSLWNGFKSWTGNLFAKVVNFAKSIPSKIKEGIGNITSVGKNLVQGIWNGISNAKNWVLDKIKGFGKSILDGLKSFFGIKSPSKVMKDQVGKNIALGVIEGINSKKKNVKKSAEELSKLYIKAANIKKLEKSGKLDAMQEITYWQTIVKHVKKGTSSYKTALSNFNKAKDNFSKSVSKLTSDFASNLNKINEDIAKRQEAIMNSLNLFDKVKFNTAVSKEALTENLQSQVNAIKEWDKTLNSLSGKIKNKDLFNYLQSQGVDSLKTLQQFDSMSAEELKKYESLYAQKENVAKKRAQNEYASQIETLKKNYLKDLASLGIDGSKTSRTVGKQIANGISSGFKSGMKNVSKTTKTQLQALLKAIKKQLKIKSPSAVFKDEIGKNIALGIGAGFKVGMKDVSSEMQNVTGKLTDDVANSISFDALYTNTDEAMKHLAYGLNNSLNPLVNPNANNLLLERQNNDSNNQSKEKESFTAIINNNSKYTSPADNVRLLRQQYELYKLKYGGGR